MIPGQSLQNRDRWAIITGKIFYPEAPVPTWTKDEERLLLPSTRKEKCENGEQTESRLISFKTGRGGGQT